MPHDPEKYLHDILSSCEFLLEFTGGRTVQDYAGDRAFRSAVERELQIIGEAVMQVERIAPEARGAFPSTATSSVSATFSYTAMPACSLPLCGA
jgi:uncharacterized protein with HEPN domain